ncbi:hypothetical protein ACIN5189_A2253 [Acinetobacter baumannii OIFC189]|nr:hypothetical protein ACIN5189_A2253 [Acinetobacter baumannii OIFC189]
MSEVKVKHVIFVMMEMVNAFSPITALPLIFTQSQLAALYF